MIRYTALRNCMPGSEPLAKYDVDVTVEDFIKDYPDVPKKELELFAQEYRMTACGYFNGMTELAYQILYDKIHPRHSNEELVERLIILRERARLFAEFNQNPEVKEEYTGADLVEREKEIHVLNKKRLDGTITEDEHWRLKTL